MMKGIANPQLKAGGLQISRNGNGKTMNAASIGGIHLFTKDLCKI